MFDFNLCNKFQLISQNHTNTIHDPNKYALNIKTGDTYNEVFIICYRNMYNYIALLLQVNCQFQLRYGSTRRAIAVYCLPTILVYWMYFNNVNHTNQLM